VVSAVGSPPSPQATGASTYAETSAPTTVTA